MRNQFTIGAVMLVGVILSGCVANRIYNPSNLPEDQLVLLTSNKPRMHLIRDSSTTYFYRVWNGEGALVINPQMLAVGPQRNAYRLPPGRYKVEVECIQGAHSANFMVSVNLEINAPKKIECVVIKTDPNYTGTVYSNISGFKTRVVPHE